jgi:hypothetical protein
MRRQVSGVCSAGFITIVQPAASAGPHFQAVHQHREVPGNDLPDHAHRLAPRVGEIIAADRNRLAVNLVGKAGVVTQHVDHQRQVAGGASRNRFAVVERFQGGQLFGVFFDQSARR